MTEGNHRQRVSQLWHASCGRRHTRRSCPSGHPQWTPKPPAATVCGLGLPSQGYRVRSWVASLCAILGCHPHATMCVLGLPPTSHHPTSHIPHHPHATVCVRGLPPALHTRPPTQPATNPIPRCHPHATVCGRGLHNGCPGHEVGAHSRPLRSFWLGGTAGAAAREMVGWGSMQGR